MSRLFRRGELKAALLQVVFDLGPTNGYAIMQGLADRIGGSWRPSPGAIYPALLALEDDGLIEGHDVDGARRYTITAKGRLAVDAQPDVVGDVAGRAASAPEPLVTVGSLLDRIVARHPGRHVRLTTDQSTRIERALAPALEEINRITAEEAP